MPKMKTHKGLSKRIKITANGKVRHKASCAGHLMSSKNAKRRRRLRKAVFLRGALAANFKRALGAA